MSHISTRSQSMILRVRWSRSRLKSRGISFVSVNSLWSFSCKELMTLRDTAWVIIDSTCSVLTFFLLNCLNLVRKIIHDVKHLLRGKTASSKFCQRSPKIPPPPTNQIRPSSKIRTFSRRTWIFFLDLRFGYFILAPPPRVIRPSHEETFAETTLFAARLPSPCTFVVFFTLRKSEKKIILERNVMYIWKQAGVKQNASEDSFWTIQSLRSIPRKSL